MNKTKIDWCNSTWNPVTGCLHGCEYCYARGIANRFSGYWDESVLRHSGSDGNIHVLEKPMYKHTTGKNRYCSVHDIQAPYPYGFDPTLHKYRLNDYRDKKGRNIFVCSMSDLFGAWVPDEWIDGIIKACESAPQHNYLFLTKNVERYIEYGVPMAANMWYGTSITKESEAHLFNSLPAFCNTFVSIEPILEDLQPEKCNILFRQVDWFIIGAETGRRKDKVIPERKWIEDVVNECRKNNKPVFMKSSLIDIWGEPLIQEFPAQLMNQWFEEESQ